MYVICDVQFWPKYCLQLLVRLIDLKIVLRPLKMYQILCGQYNFSRLIIPIFRERAKSIKNTSTVVKGKVVKTFIVLVNLQRVWSIKLKRDTWISGQVSQLRTHNFIWTWEVLFQRSWIFFKEVSQVLCWRRAGASQFGPYIHL